MVKLEKICVPLYINLLKSAEALEILEYGVKTAPLSLIGSFLGSIGKVILEYCRINQLHLSFKSAYKV